MAWQPLVTSRRAKAYYNDANPSQKGLNAFHLPIHYEGTLDSGQFDTPVDYTLNQVNNAQLDGWTVTGGDWHLAAGIDKLSHPGEDGWFGIGFRQGGHYLKLRLERVGYLRFSNLTWTGLGGTASYTRSGNLSFEAQQVQSDFEPDPITAGFTGSWRNLWSTPGGGEAWLELIGDSDGLKLNPVINKAGWDWAKTQYPGTGPQQTQYYFGFVFRLDHGDIPRAYKNGVLQSLSGDFDDDSGTTEIEFRDDLDRLLGFMPLDDIIVRDEATGDELSRLRLRKRIYQDGATTYLIVGARVDQLNALSVPTGAVVVFDPTIDAQHAASGLSAKEIADGTVTTGGSTVRSNAAGDYGAWRWAGLAVDQGVTLTSAYMELYFNNTSRDNANHTFYCEDADDAATFTGGAGSFDLSTRALTTGVSWVNSDITGGTVGYYQTPSLVVPFQAVFDRPSWVNGNDATNIITRTSGDIQVATYTLNPAQAPKLHLEWSTGTTYNFTTAINSTSSTPDTGAIAAARPMAAAVSSTSSTPDTGTPALALPEATTIASTSSTPDTGSLASTLAVSASIASTSSTPDTASQSAARAVASAVASTSSTPDGATAVERAVSAAAASTSSTPDNGSLDVGAGQATNVTSASSTPDTGTLANARSVAASVTSTSSTPDTGDADREMTSVSAIASTSSTPDTGELSTGQDTATQVASLSETPDAGSLAVARALAVSVVSDSLAGDPTTAVVRPETTSVSSQSTTGAASLLMTTPTVVDISSASFAPDDATTAMAVSRTVIVSSLSGAEASATVERSLVAAATSGSITADTVLLGYILQLTVAIASLSATPAPELTVSVGVGVHVTITARAVVARVTARTMAARVTARTR